MTELLYPPTLSSQLQVVYQTFVARIKTLSRYRFVIIMEILMPLMMAVLPLLMGTAIGGPNAMQNFEENTGTKNATIYFLIGSVIFFVISSTFWNFGVYLRREQQIGTLEALYLAPIGRWPLLIGTGMYIIIRTLFSGILTLLIGSLLFDAQISGDILVAILFLIVGLIPLFGISLIYGALIMKVKETGSLINVIQWLVSFLVGVFYPIAVLPWFFRIVAYLFPPTWMMNGVRSSLLELDYFMGAWYLDIAVLVVLAFLIPNIAMWIFSRTENGIRRNEGVGKF